MKLNSTSYIARIDEIINMVNEGKQPVQMAVLAESLRTARPDDSPQSESDAADYMTSAEIRDRLAEVCDLSLNEIAEVMTALGYRIHVDIFSGAQWAMKEPHAD